MQVAQGYRRPLPEAWPEILRDLVKRCMEQEPRERPTALQVQCLFGGSSPLNLGCRRNWGV